MKIATKKIALYVLTAVFALCIGAFAAFSFGVTKTVNADDPTEKNVTFTGLESTWNNYAYNSGGYTKYSLLKFTGGISSGSHVAGNMDFSDLIANTTYTGSSNTWSFYPSSLLYGVDKANNNQLIFRTASNPQGGDTLTINAGAWFITGGEANEKYVITDEIRIRFNGTTWVQITPFTFTGAVTWNGVTYIACYGFEASSFVNTGAFALLATTSALADDYTNNYASTVGNYILFNGTPLSEISGSAIGVYAGQLIVYVHGYLSGVVQICKDTVIGNKYTSEDYYFVVVNKAWGQAMTAANDVSFSTTGTGLTWNGSNSGGMELGGIASGVPASGTCSLINVIDTPLGAGETVQANLKYSLTGKTILCDGTPLYDIEGAVVGVFVGYLFIYIPGEDCIVTIQEGTIIGKSNYKVDQDYTYHFKKGSGQSSLCYLVDFDSNGGTEVADVYVHNGATVAAPTAPTKASVGNTDYTFGHWEDEGGDEFNFSTAITANTTLTATWTEVSTVYLTLNNVGGVQAQNNYLIGSIYYTALSFNHGVSTGESLAYDFSHLGAEYSNTSITPNWISGVHLGYTANSKSESVFNFIYFTTPSVPETGATIAVKAGGWFTIGGTINDKYVISEDFSITFDGSAWATLPSYYLWDSRDMSAPIRQVVESKDGDDFVYTMPTDLSFDGYKVFGFAITDNEAEYFYPAGGEHKSSASDLAVIAIIGAFDMNSGASIRITTAETSGIRWTATVDATVKGHILYWGKTGTAFGTELSADGFSQNYDIATKYWATDTTFSAVLADVNSDYYTTNFTAKAYVDIAYSDGTTARIYADNVGVTRSIRQVAGAALDDVMANWTDRQEEILTAIAGR